MEPVGPVLLRQPLADGLHVKTDSDHLLVVEDSSAVENERGLHHLAVYQFVVQIGELLPLGADHDGSIN